MNEGPNKRLVATADSIPDTLWQVYEAERRLQEESEVEAEAD